MATFIIIIGLVMASLLIPARWDPAIRLKEWQGKSRRED